MLNDAILDPRSSILDPRSSILDPRSALLRSLLCGFLCGFLSSLCGLLGRRFFSSLLGRSARNLLSGFLRSLLGPVLRRFCGWRRHGRRGRRGFRRERRGRRSDARNDWRNHLFLFFFLFFANRPSWSLLAAPFSASDVFVWRGKFIWFVFLRGVHVVSLYHILFSLRGAPLQVLLSSFCR